MNNKINLIFDFDGTLVDSLDAIIANFNILANEFNLRHLAANEINSLKFLPSKELIKYLNIPIYKIPNVLVRARTLMRSEITKLQPFENMPEILKEIHKTNVNMGILTSNSLNNVTEWLKCNDMQNLFHFVHAESSFFGKKQILKKVMKNHAMELSSTFYIGDETRDIEAAKSCKINSIAVVWGFSAETVLLQHQPHFVARKPEDILTICEKINNL